MDILDAAAQLSATLGAIPYSPHLQSVLVLLAGALAVASLVIGRTSFAAAWRPLKGLPNKERQRIHRLAAAGASVTDPADAPLARAHALAWLRSFDTKRYRLRMALLELSMLLAFVYPLVVHVSRGEWGRALLGIIWLGLCAGAFPYMQRVNDRVRHTVDVNSWSDETAAVGER